MFQASFQALKETSSVHKACPFRELTFNGRQVGLHEIAHLPFRPMVDCLCRFPQTVQGFVYRQCSRCTESL